MGKINIKTDRELEENILGCLLKDVTGLKDESVAKLKPSDFQYGSHRILFKAITELYNSDQSVDTITVTSRLKEIDKLEKVGGAYWVDGLITEKLVLTSNLPAYAEIFSIAIIMNFVSLPSISSVKSSSIFFPTMAWPKGEW
mgnify:CR=1 FL=1